MKPEGKGKILIADDMDTFLRLEKMLLEHSGYQIFMARTGTEALKLIQSEKPDLVFLDLMMPEMTGDVVCRFVKNNRALSQIKVIMVSTKGDQEAKDKCFQAGCDDYLTKPITKRDLIEKITQHLRPERRLHKRVPLKVRSRYWTEGGKVFTDYSLNLSLGGIFIETKETLPIGTEVNLEFSLPMFQEPVRAKGAIVRVASPEPEKGVVVQGMGIKFLDLTDKDREKISRYVEKKGL